MAPRDVRCVPTKQQAAVFPVRACGCSWMLVVAHDGEELVITRVKGKVDVLIEQCLSGGESGMGLADLGFGATRDANAVVD